MQLSKNLDLTLTLLPKRFAIRKHNVHRIQSSPLKSAIEIARTSALSLKVICVTPPSDLCPLTSDLYFSVSASQFFSFLLRLDLNRYSFVLFARCSLLFAPRFYPITDN